MKNLKHMQSHNIRPTIGFLTVCVHQPNDELVWLGAVDAAREYDLNLLCFVGGNLDNPDGFAAQANVVYDLVNKEDLDGLIIWSGTVGWYLDQQGLAEFCRRYAPLPRVSIEEGVAGIPSIFKDNYAGMREAMVHLIEIHGYRRIAFLQGPENILWAQERYQAYSDTLDAYGLPVDPALISPPLQGWDQDSAARLITFLLDERGLQPGRDFEAALATTDTIARNTIAFLQVRGINVPGDMAIVGFDDEKESRVISPPLTTVRNPAYELGWQSVEALFAQLQGQDPAEKVVVPTKLVVRQSCGCKSLAIEQAVVEPAIRLRVKSEMAESFETAFSAQREKILSGMIQAECKHPVPFVNRQNDC